MTPREFTQAISAVPTGAWVVAVSGGADSVALLKLLCQRNDLHLVVAHLNHETRGDDSDADEQFVNEMAASLHIPIYARRLGDLILSSSPNNPSERFRIARHTLFREAIAAHQCDGIVLAHHLDDQIESFAASLLRDSLRPLSRQMKFDTTIAGMRVVRPLLDIRSETLRAFLQLSSQSWREDASNASDQYARNRLRTILREPTGLFELLKNLRNACRELDDWTGANAFELAEEIDVDQIALMPRIIARFAVAQWLGARLGTLGDLTRESIERVIQMCEDAASPAQASITKGMTLRRRRGKVFIDH